MPLSEQESRCVTFLCQHLNQTRGGEWSVAGLPDDEHPSEPSPDVLLTNDTGEIAVEIKRLTDGDVLDSRRVAELSLQRSLAPKTGGAFRLHPSRGSTFPFARKTAQHLRSVVPGIACKLDIGESAGVPVRRRAVVKCIDEKAGSFVSCWHVQTGAVVRSVSCDLEGTYYLDDAEQPEHQFVTEESELAFREALRQACEAASPGSDAELEWDEAWRLVKVGSTAAGEGIVSLFGIAIADPDLAAADAVKKAIGAARQAFSARKWAPMSAAALHAGDIGWVLGLGDFERAVSALNAAHVSPLDIVFLVAEDGVREFRYS